MAIINNDLFQGKSALCCFFNLSANTNEIMTVPTTTTKKSKFTVPCMLSKMKSICFSNLLRIYAIIDVDSFIVFANIETKYLKKIVFLDGTEYIAIIRHIFALDDYKPPYDFPA